MKLKQLGLDKIVFDCQAAETEIEPATIVLKVITAHKIRVTGAESVLAAAALRFLEAAAVLGITTILSSGSGFTAVLGINISKSYAKLSL